FSAISLTLRTMSVTSSRTPASDENSCSTPSILIEVTAAPWSELSSTRRSELPRVMPKPRSKGSATKAARRRWSPPDCFFSSALGFLSSCQFFALTAIFLPHGGHLYGVSPFLHCLARDAEDGVPRNPNPSSLDAPPLRRPDPVVRDRGDVADAGDLEADRL